MKKFYIIYKDGSTIEGELFTDHKTFVQKIINPNVDEIETYQFWNEEHEEIRRFLDTPVSIF